MMIAPLIALAAAALGQWTPATEARLSREYRACQGVAERADTNSGGYIDDVTRCAEPELARQDARLNQAYKMVMMRLTPQRKANLRALQRRWIADRDRICDRDVANGGTAEYMDSRQCHLSRTINRTIWLERYR